MVLIFCSFVSFYTIGFDKFIISFNSYSHVR